MIERAVILAVGSPTHQSQLTYNRPFVMLPALGKPLVVRVMDRLRRIGIRKFVVVVGQDEGALAAYLNTQWYPNVEVDFVLRWSGESLAKILAEIARQHRQPFIVTTYYNFTHAHFPERLVNIYQKENVQGLLLGGAPTTLSSSSVHDYAHLDGERVLSISRERQPMILGEMAVAGSDFVDYLAALSPIPFTSQLIDIFRLYIEQGGAACFAEAAWLLPVKADADLLTLNRHLLDEAQDAHILSELPASVRIIPPVRIDPQVSVGQGAIIGPHVYLESRCSIGQGVTLRDAVVLQNAVIPAGDTVANMVVSSRARIRV